MSHLVYVILFLSLRACSCARHLGVTDRRFGRKAHPNGKDLEQDVQNTRLQTTLSLPLRHSNPEELLTQGELKALGTLPLGNQMDPKAILKEDKSNGREVAMPYSAEDYQKTTEGEGWRRQSRSTLGSAPDEAEETVNSKENDIIEDVVVMDYAQPHRKPPIHNIKP